MSEVKTAKQWAEELTLKHKNGLLKISGEEMEKANAFCEDYKAYLDAAKTEREAAEEAIRLAKAAGFSEFVIGKKYNAGDRVYVNNRGKSVAFAVIGEEPVEKGMRISAAHIDSPRLD